MRLFVIGFVFLFFLDYHALSKAPALHVKKIAAETMEEAENIIQNYQQYLGQLFEQSYDEYYGTPTWSEKCLKENKIGQVKKDSSGIILSSRLVVNKSYNTGFCLDNDGAILVNRLMYYCKGSSAVVVKFYKQKEKLQKKSLKTLCLEK